MNSIFSSIKTGMLCVSAFMLCSGIISISADAADDISKDTLTQISTINSLMAANYDGTYTFEQIKKYGDFGIGTVDGLDGELICLDGKFYQVPVEGKVKDVPDSMKTPFADLTFFEKDESFEAKDITLEELENQILSKLDKNYIYAIRVDGEFETVKTRSVRADKPYKPLAEVAKGQKVFDFTNVKGTLVGFHNPAYINGISTVGFHLHFLSDDKNGGGHLLAVKIKDAIISLDKTKAFNLVLPENFDPGTAKKEEVDAVEKLKK